MPKSWIHACVHEYFFFLQNAVDAQRHFSWTEKHNNNKKRFHIYTPREMSLKGVWPVAYIHMTMHKSSIVHVQTH